MHFDSEYQVLPRSCMDSKEGKGGRVEERKKETTSNRKNMLKQFSHKANTLAKIILMQTQRNARNKM